MATPTRRHFTDTIKSDAVRLAPESERSVAQVARELGISDNVLYRWGSEQQQIESQGRTRQVVRAEQDEQTWHKRENRTLKKERDFLKRAAAFSTRESLARCVCPAVDPSTAGSVRLQFMASTIDNRGKGPEGRRFPNEAAYRFIS